MAAPRKYTDAQRQAVWNLHERGLTSGQISEACAAGTASVAAFEIPRRSVSDLITRMAREAAVKPPSDPADVTTVELVSRFPERIARIFDAELERLEAKQRRGQLTAKDIDLMRKATNLCGPLKKRLEGRSIGPARSSRRPGSQAEQESVLAKLARELAEEEAGMVHPGSTHRRQADEDHVGTSAPAPPPAPTAPNAAIPVEVRRAQAVAAAREAAESTASSPDELAQIRSGFDQAQAGGGSSSSAAA